jgi:hypothetical protein
MTPTKSQNVAFYLAALALACWVMMFLAAHDIWHDAGRPDLHMMGATYFDLRAFTWAFYLLGLCVAGAIIALVVSARRS